MILISYTFLNTYKRCHKWAYLQYVKGVIDRSTIDHRPFMVGIVVDWLFTKWVEQGYPPNWMEEKAEAMFNWFANRRHIHYRHSLDKEQLVKQTVTASRLLEEAAYEWELPKRKIETQKVLSFKGYEEFEDLEFYGKIDLWFPEEKLIWDLKITKSKKYMDDFQLKFFSWLMSVQNEEVKGLAFLVPLLSPSVQEVNMGYNEMAEFEQDLYALLLDVKSEEEWAATAQDCWNCPAKARCEQDFSSSLLSTKRDDGGIEIEFKEE